MDLAEAYAATDEARAAYEAEMVSLVERVLTDQAELAASAYEEGAEAGADSVATAVESARPMMEAAFDVIYEGAFPAFAARSYDGLQALLPPPSIDGGKHRTPTRTKAEEDLWLEAARLWVRENAGRLISAISQTTLGLIRGLVEEGLAEGLGPKEVARKIRQDWAEIARYRAERIARTETLRASSIGAQAGAQRAQEALSTSGLVLEKVWLATVGDARTRATHLEAHEQARLLDEPYEVGGFSAMHPHDVSLPASESVNCRCAEVYRIRDGSRKP